MTHPHRKTTGSNGIIRHRAARQKCDQCGNKRVIVHVDPDGGKWCRPCDDEWRSNPAPGSYQAAEGRSDAR